MQNLTNDLSIYRYILNLIVLRCNKIHNTRNFYELLGFIFNQEKHGKGPIHYATTIDNIVLELYPASSRFPVDSCRLGFTVASFNEVKSLSYEVIIRDKQEIMLLKDPDNRVIEVISNDQR